MVQDTSEYVQLSLQLDEHLGEAVAFPMDADRVGGNLLPILSKGLYTNPLHCMREYVQNAVDAGAREVTIQITGNSVIISDDGDGSIFALFVCLPHVVVHQAPKPQHIERRGRFT